jgi:hypothetical protein
MEIQALKRCLTAASESGIRSLDQLNIFLAIAEAGETDALSLAGADETRDAEVRKVMGHILPLSRGTIRTGGVPSRGLGLILHRPGAFPSKTGKKPLTGFRLSAKGRRLAASMGLKTNTVSA